MIKIAYVKELFCCLDRQKMDVFLYFCRVNETKECPMRKILPLIAFVLFLLASCGSMENWLFNASDYHLINSRTDDESLENNLYWDDFDYDIWDEELEYD